MVSLLNFLLSSFQEMVELKQVENISDTEGYPSLEGHCRAASLPRLNAEYYVSSSQLMMPVLLLYCSKKGCMIVFFVLHSCDGISLFYFLRCRHCGYVKCFLVE